MDVLIVGSGGREHALAWKLAQSPRAGRIVVAPGNGGTPENLPLQAECAADFPALVAFAQREKIGLTVVGPEVPLAAGIVDAFQAAGLRCFGPSRAAAQLEASKTFAKAFMARHGIPAARSAAFHDYPAARDYLGRAGHDVVIKASGLAAGKGVIVPDGMAEAEAALHEIMVDRAFGEAGDEVLIEERLVGPEASVLAFSDGQHVVPMPAAQDHKRAFDGDQGPNTGGMGAYAPAPLVSPALMEEIRRNVLEPAVAGMRDEGHPYVGVLYAGLMMTAGGPRVLEFNCRFGDPETQVILPLLDGDLLEVMERCLDGGLDGATLRWKEGAAATVVAASQGYPGSYPKGCEIAGLGDAGVLKGTAVFHAGTRRAEDGRLFTAGGRVLAVTGTGASLREAIDRAYAGLAQIHFDGMHFRHDIGGQGAGIKLS